LKDKGLGYRKIARELNSRGLTTHSDKEWGSSYVYAVLKRHKEHLERKKYRNRKFPLIYSKSWIE
tara:strand:- start:201 stop:395 length:195 start_codon:yes stop_codon:yes gene_type:complete